MKSYWVAIFCLICNIQAARVVWQHHIVTRMSWRRDWLLCHKIIISLNPLVPIRLNSTAAPIDRWIKPFIQTIWNSAQFIMICIYIWIKFRIPPIWSNTWVMTPGSLGKLIAKRTNRWIYTDPNRLNSTGHFSGHFTSYISIYFISEND